MNTFTLIIISPLANSVIASEAKQSRRWQHDEIKADCFVTSFLAKTLNKLFCVCTIFATITPILFTTGCTRNDRGEALFKEKCSYCHPDGGNISRGEKGLNQNALRKNNIRNTDDIVAYLRSPGPDMPTFDEQSLPVKDAALVAEYIVKNFR